MTITGPEFVFYCMALASLAAIIMALAIKLGRAQGNIEKLERKCADYTNDYWRKDIQLTALEDTLKNQRRDDYNDGYKAGYDKGLEDGTNVWDML